jgi:hypothetical protein
MTRELATNTAAVRRTDWHRRVAPIPGVASLALLCPATVTGADLETELRRCAGLTGDEARLACYDAAVGAAGLRPAAPAGDSASTSASAAPAPGPASDDTASVEAAPAGDAAGAADDAAVAAFGRDAVDPPEAAREPREIRAVVERITERRDQILVFTLANGQVWRQKSFTSLFRVREGDEIVIRKGRFGGYTLVAPGRRTTQVTRIE